MTKQCWAAFLFFLGVGQVSADQQSIRVIRSENAESELQLEVRQASLKQVLDKIAGDTGLVIHYSVLPEGSVTATCAGTTLKQVLECLLDHKADLIFRYPGASSRSAAQIQPEEVWVLKTKFEVLPGTANSSVYKTVVTQQQTMQTTTGAQADTEYTAPDQTNALIEKAGSKNPSDRSDAIAELQEALHDNDASVRLKAVNSIGNNADLLQQALTDSDDKVRKLAAMKLESLSNAEPRQQVMQKTASAQTDNEPSAPDQIDALLERAKSNNPVDRVDAISRLLTAGKAGDASVRTVLEEALADNYASVRAQAISSLARSEGDDATAALQVALNDSDASVRLMAVDSMGSNTALLQQALTDNDATVRELAKIRLESLSNTTSSK